MPGLGAMFPHVRAQEDMFDDPHFAAREAIVNVPHPDFGSIPMQNATPKLSETPGRIRTAGPALGEHNDEIYGGLIGLDETERARLRQHKII